MGAQLVAPAQQPQEGMAAAATAGVQLGAGAQPEGPDAPVPNPPFQKGLFVKKSQDGI